MINIRNISKKRKIADQQVRLRNTLWPNLDEARLWDPKESDGWYVVPRTFPIILRIMDELAPKGMPVSVVYLDIWCRIYSPEQAFVKLGGHHDQMAFYCGYNGERAVHTWRSRIQILGDLKFIEIAPSSESDLGYALVLNPYLVIFDLWKKNPNCFSTRLYNALQERAVAIGSQDLEKAEVDSKAIEEEQKRPKKLAKKAKKKPRKLSAASSTEAKASL